MNLLLKIISHKIFSMLIRQQRSFELARTEEKKFVNEVSVEYSNATRFSKKQNTSGPRFQLKLVSTLFGFLLFSYICFFKDRNREKSRCDYYWKWPDEFYFIEKSPMTTQAGKLCSKHCSFYSFTK